MKRKAQTTNSVYRAEAVLLRKNPPVQISVRKDRQRINQKHGR